MPDQAIRIHDIGKRYRLGAAREPYKTLRDTLAGAAPSALRRIRRSLRRGPSDQPMIWALRNVTVDIPPGEVVGIIGRNGAGKSTLLKVLCRITEPSEGSATMAGRVGSLLEVGTGFHPELTGRENIFLNGAILGMRRVEIASKLDAIIAFSGVEQFVDTPVKRYSSGMYLRLAFSVAAHLETEILLVDEVLAVGDAEFQRKCIGKMSEISRQGRTVLFVSHQLGAIAQLCDRALLFEKGRLAADGPAAEVVHGYLQSVSDTAGHQAHFPEKPAAPMQVTSVESTGADGRHRGRFDIADAIRLRVKYVVRGELKGTNLALLVHREGTDVLCTFDTDNVPELLERRAPGSYECDVVLPTRTLKAGLYTVSVGCGFVNRQSLELHRDAIAFHIEALSEDTSSRGYAESRAGILLGPVEWRPADARAAGQSTPGFASVLSE